MISINSKEEFDLSPYLYMQFMEPLGSTDSSTDAAWDYINNRWRPDVIECVEDLAPPLVRLGGCWSSFYRWKEGVGSLDKRVPMINLLWGGIDPNHIGTDEFIDFCRKTGADPLININFESDGREHWGRPARGGIRSADADEAAAWVDYCNNPDNMERKANGYNLPHNVKLWQIGNETSYDKRGFGVEDAAVKTLKFAKAMRKADSSIELIGWGDSGWAERMLEVNGNELEYLAFHHMIDPGTDIYSHMKNMESPIIHHRYKDSPSEAWEYLMEIPKIVEAKILKMREDISGSSIYLAKTEAHLTIEGRNRGEILSSWAHGVMSGLIMNIHERHGDLLKIATFADFLGNRWLVNALMIPTPGKKTLPPYLLPVAQVMKLFGKNIGRVSARVGETPQGIDISASRTDQIYYLHIVNKKFREAVKTPFLIENKEIEKIEVEYIQEDPYLEIDEYNAPNVKIRKEELFKKADGQWSWTIPSGSVCVAKIKVKD